MWKNCKIINLPSEGEVGRYQLCLNTNGYKAPFFSQGITRGAKCIPQHLYLLSDDEIKVGDWAHSSEYNDIFKVIITLEKRAKLRKIIASTDKFLRLPGIHANFLVEYCEAGGIEDVRVMYDEEYTEGGVFTGNYKLRVTNNTPFITIPKTSWSKEEVEALCRKAYHQGKEDCARMRLPKEFLDQWIHENIKSRTKH